MATYIYGRYPQHGWVRPLPAR